MIDCRDIEYREREVDIFEKYFVIYNQPQTIKKCIHKWTEEGTLSKIDNMIYTVCPGSSDPPGKLLNIFTSENEVYTIF